MATSSEVLQRPHSATTLACMQFAAGGMAGFVEVSIMHPLDLVKTRFQIQGGVDDLTRYNSLRDCFKTMYKTEGPLSFYKGILPPLLADTPKRAIKFFTFERYKTFFLYAGNMPVPVIYSLAGLCSGLTEAIVINPFEVVKVRLQADRRNIHQQKSTMATARQIIHENGFGLRGLNKGLPATFGRHGIFNMVYFGFYFSMKGALPEYKDPSTDLFKRFVLGLIAGTLASCLNIPFDVAKSRIQGPQPVPGQIKYRHCFPTIKCIYVEEGFRALYKGLVPKVLRLGPGGAIMLLVYETSFEWMKTNL